MAMIQPRKLKDVEAARNQAVTEATDQELRRSTAARVFGTQLGVGVDAEDGHRAADQEGHRQPHTPGRGG
jgi:hypothetical protein